MIHKIENTWAWLCVFDSFRDTVEERLNIGCSGNWRMFNVCEIVIGRFGSAVCNDLKKIVGGCDENKI